MQTSRLRDNLNSTRVYFTGMRIYLRYLVMNASPFPHHL